MKKYADESKTENCKLKTANCNLALLALLLTGLKLTGCINCSWLLVLAPLWLPAAIFTAVFLILLTIKIIHK